MRYLVFSCQPKIEDAGGRPAVAVDDAALERGVDLAWRGLHDGGTERGEEVAVDRGDPDLEPGQVRLGDRLRQIDVERRVADLAGQEDGIHLLVVELGHVVEAAVLAQLGHRPLRELPGVRLREHVGVEGAGDVGDVDHAGFERIADLEGRHRLGAADVVDADLALALGVDDVDEALEAARVQRLLGERGDALERHLLGVSCGARGRQNQRCRSSGQSVVHDVLPARARILAMETPVPPQQEHGAVPVCNMARAASP